jgi:hypothetical protein
VDRLRGPLLKGTSAFIRGHTFGRNFFEFEPRLVMSKLSLAEKIRNLAEAPLPWGVRAVPLLCVLYPVLSLTTEEKRRGKISVSVVETSQLNTIHCVDMAAFCQVARTCLSIPFLRGAFKRPVSSLGQHRYLLTCITKGFPIPANVCSILSVINLM